MKILVGLSGGVDSSVVLQILKNKNYDVEAAFMRNWDSLTNNDILGNKVTDDEPCEQELDYQDALNVANKIGAKLHRVDFVKEYWDYVFTYFISEYKKGRTPNPDILCNKYIKFDQFLKFAKNTVTDFSKLATGHYARVIFNKKTQEYDLLKGKDESKDQSYFLCQLNQEQLSQTLFPLGELTKKEVRKMAEENDLITADKKDSTGICFIGERNFKQFLENYIPNQKGDIVDIATGEKVGNHVGVMYYTIGQRKGLNLGGFELPYYTVGKDMDKKILYVANDVKQQWLISNSCIVENVNFINKTNKTTFKCNVKFRYRQKDIPASVEILEDNKIKIIYKDTKSVTPGQSAVLYSKDKCLGGEK